MPPPDHRVPHRADPLDDVSVPALLRAARRTYGRAVRSALEEVGDDDLPRNGPFVLGAIARGGTPLSTVIRALGVSKQAGGQLVDTLVLRGYLARTPDPDDRRRTTVVLTERGDRTAAVCREAVAEVDAALAEWVGADDVRTMRRALVTLARLDDSGSGSAPDPPD